MSKFLICNLKEHKTLLEILDYRKILKNINNKNFDLIVCPSYPYIPILHADNYKLGAQDVSKFESGIYTGEVSINTLKSLDVKFIICGHSERKEYLKETEGDILEKINIVTRNKLYAIYPIGENEIEHRNHDVYNILKEKLDNLLAFIPFEQLDKLIIAYEPCWLINTHKELNIKEINDAISFIKTYVIKVAKKRIKVVYGGGVNEDNIVSLNNINILDGFLISNSALNPNNIQKLISRF